jgi:hypothetical protein
VSIAMAYQEHSEARTEAQKHKPLLARIRVLGIVDQQGVLIHHYNYIVVTVKIPRPNQSLQLPGRISTSKGPSSTPFLFIARRPRRPALEADVRAKELAAITPAVPPARASRSPGSPRACIGATPA